MIQKANITAGTLIYNLVSLADQVGKSEFLQPYRTLRDTLPSYGSCCT